MTFPVECCSVMPSDAVPGNYIGVTTGRTADEIARSPVDIDAGIAADRVIAREYSRLIEDANVASINGVPSAACSTDIDTARVKTIAGACADRAGFDGIVCAVVDVNPLNGIARRTD